MSSYSIDLQTLTPIHIGGSQELLPLEFCAASDGLGVVDTEALFSRTPRLRDRMLARLSSRPEAALTSDLWQEFGPEKESLWKTPDIWRYKLRYWGASGEMRQQMGREMQRSRLTIRTFSRSPDGRSYLPGSSLKGALRTALLFHRLQQDAGLLRQVTTEVGSLLAARRSDRDIKRALEGVVFGNIRGNRMETDVMRLFRLTDVPVTADALGMERVVSAPLRAGGSREAAPGRFKEFCTFLELAELARPVRFRLTLDEAAFENPKVRTAAGWTAAHGNLLVLDEIFRAVNGMAAAVVEGEMAYFRRLSSLTHDGRDVDFSGVLKFYEQLHARLKPAASAQPSECFLSLGRGSGWNRLGVGMLLLPSGPDDLRRWREALRLAPRHLDFVFPKSRKLLMKSAAAVGVPLGWVRLAKVDKQ